MSKVPDEMLEAVKSYRGSISKCRSGRVAGAGDLTIWASRRAVGSAGVPDVEFLEKQEQRAKQRNTLYVQYQNSGLTHKMTYKKWLRRQFARWDQAKKSRNVR